MHMVLKFHSVGRFLYRKKIPLLPNIICKLSRIIFSCDLKHTTKIGENVKFYHNGLGVVIHPNSEIGSGTSIYQNVTLGGNGKPEKLNGAPIIGKNVFIGAGAVLLGPIKVGDNATIGSNAVVVNDVKANSTVLGIPAKEKQ